MGTKEQRKLHIGEKHINKQGLEFEIIDWLGSDNVTVQFSDGTTKNRCAYNNIKRGTCPHPTIKPHIGEKYINTQGYEYEIIDWLGSDNVTVQFSDGTTKNRCEYGNIKRGSCPHPTIKPHIGEKYINTQGLGFEIIGWIDAKNITVQFTDGTIREGCQYERIKRGQCPHPAFIHNKVSEYAGFLTEPRAFEKNGNSYYPCICQKCNYKDILTPQEMVEHRKKC